MCSDFYFERAESALPPPPPPHPLSINLQRMQHPIFHRKKITTSLFDIQESATFPAKTRLLKVHSLASYFVSFWIKESKKEQLKVRSTKHLNLTADSDMDPTDSLPFIRYFEKLSE